MVNTKDAVATRLASAGASPTTILRWIESRQRRHALFRRALWCTLGSWLLVTAAAAIGGGVAFKFARDVEDTFRDLELMDLSSYRDHVVQVPATIHFVPPFLAACALALFAGGLIALFTGRFPGLRWTHSAIDWEESTDAVSRLLAAGCTYPDAFEVAAQAARTRSNRRWLTDAANQVKQGATDFKSATTSGDVVMLQSLLEITESESSTRWIIAKRHFAEVARRRLALLQGTLPMVGTLLAGLLIWFSISATLGWMWVTVTRMGGLH